MRTSVHAPGTLEITKAYGSAIIDFSKKSGCSLTSLAAKVFILASPIIVLLTLLLDLIYSYRISKREVTLVTAKPATPYSVLLMDEEGRAHIPGAEGEAEKAPYHRIIVIDPNGVAHTPIDVNTEKEKEKKSFLALEAELPFAKEDIY